MGAAYNRILVTGAGGFIGSHLVEHLLAQGYAVRAFVHYNSLSSWGWLDQLAAEHRAGLDVFAGDIRDPYGVREACRGMDAVLHLAALIGIPYSYHSPDSYLDTNIRGTLNVLNAVRDLGLSRVLVTSTSEVYGTARSVPIAETHVRQPQSPYSATKIGADALAESYHLSFGTPVTIVRPFNTYGPRQSARAVIPTIITQLLQGQAEIRLGSLSPRRDLVFCGDTAEGFRRIQECPAAIGADVNIATGEDVSIGELAETIIELIRPGARVVSDDERVRPENSEVQRLLGSAAKLRGLTGWAPATSLRDGLAQTIEWFRDPAHLAGYKADRYNV